MDRIKKALTVLFLWLGSLHAWDYQEFAYDKDWLYQDMWIDNEVIFKGVGPDCPSRFEALRPLFERFGRPFTILEVGANNGYFCFRAAYEYDATCIMIDGTDRLTKLCQANSSLNKIVYLQKYVDAEDLSRLAKTDHFDVVLCFHVLHHVGWKPFFEALMQLGDYVVIETPPENDGFVELKPSIPEIARYLTTHPKGILIGSFERQSPEIWDHMLLFSNVASPRWEPLQPGISCRAFHKLNGAYPQFAQLPKAPGWYLLGKEGIVQR